MDAVEYLKTIKRMCELYKPICWGEDNHTPCELRIKANAKGMSCSDYTATFSEEAVEIIEKWSKAHPARTRQDIYLEEQIPSFLKKFVTIIPKVDSNGALDLCPADVYCEADCKLDSKENHGKPPKDVCDECHKIFWLREVE